MIDDVVKQAADKIKQSVGKTLRCDHVQAIELVTSLPEEAAIDHVAYFDCFLSWASDEFGAENLVSADVHMDESARHCHLLVLPVVNGVYTGARTVNGQRFTALKASFAKRVGAPYGLRFAPRVTDANKQEAVDLTMRALQEKDDPVLRSRIRSLVERAIRSDPRPFLMELGMNIPISSKKKKRTMAEIFTSPGKGPTREGFN